MVSGSFDWGQVLLDRLSGVFNLFIDRSGEPIVELFAVLVGYSGPGVYRGRSSDGSVVGQIVLVVMPVVPRGRGPG